MADAFSWSFSFRDNTHDDDDDKDGEGEGGSTVDTKVNEDDMDLASREETAQFKPNPWSIAKINSSSRQPPSVKSKAPARTSGPAAPKTAPILSAFRKQVEKKSLTVKSISRPPPEPEEPEIVKLTPPKTLVHPTNVTPEPLIMTVPQEILNAKAVPVIAPRAALTKLKDPKRVKDPSPTLDPARDAEITTTTQPRASPEPRATPIVFPRPALIAATSHRNVSKAVGTTSNIAPPNQLPERSTKSQFKEAPRWKPAPILSNRMVPLVKKTIPNSPKTSSDAPASSSQSSHTEHQVSTILDELELFSRVHSFSPQKADHFVDTPHTPYSQGHYSGAPMRSFAYNFTQATEGVPQVVQSRPCRLRCLLRWNAG